MSWDDIRKQIVQACTRLEAENLVEGSSGNVSVRLPPQDGRELLAITPSRVPYRVLRPEQVLIIDMEAKVVAGDGSPSSETKTHLAAYRARSDVGAVIHSHSVYASALAVAGHDLPVLIDEQTVSLGGAIRCAAYGLSATDDLARNAVEALDVRQAVLLANHGLLGVGRDLDEVLDVVAFVERLAKIYVLARTLGEPQRLPDNVLDVLAKFYRMQRGFPVEQ